MNINVPGAPPGRRGRAAGQAHLPRRAALVDEADGGRRLYRIYGDAELRARRDRHDLAAVAAGQIAVTPIHFDLTDRDGLTRSQRYDLARLIAPAADEVS